MMPMPVPSKEIFIIGAKRTPFCQYGGPLRKTPASYAFAAAGKDAIHSAKIDPALIDETVVGNVNYLSQCDGGKTPRYCGLYSGVPVERPALGVSKACGTGLQAIITGAMNILVGTSKISLTGGTEIMSSLPMLVRNVRFGTTLGTPYIFEDHIQPELVDNSGLRLEKTAEVLIQKYKIDRKEVEEFALKSYIKWKAAQDANAFAEEITSMKVDIEKELIIDRDQPQATLNNDQHQKSTIRRKDNDDEVTTRGGSAVAADGAAALLLASKESIKEHNISPLAKVAGWSCVGVDPADTGMAAAKAIRKLLDERGMKVGDVDLFEINETFAAQVLATAMELNIDLSKVNTNGGALAIGHPVSATGARMTASLVYELRRRNAKRAIAASSCGGGQGIALMLEAV